MKRSEYKLIITALKRENKKKRLLKLGKNVFSKIKFIMRVIRFLKDTYFMIEVITLVR